MEQQERKQPCVGRVGRTHGGCLIPKEVDGVKSLIVEHIEAVALVPALWEDVKADHATCQEKRGHQATLLGAGCLGRAPTPNSSHKHQLCRGVPLGTWLG